jgi:hypothetical protein
MVSKSPIPLTAQQILVRAALSGMLKASPVLDRFCGWVLGLGGITLGLLVSNLDSVKPCLSVSVIRQFAWMFLLVFLLGFLEKFIAAMIEAGLSSSEEVEGALHHLMSEEVEVVDAPLDPKLMIAEIRASVWYPMKWLVGFGAAKGAKDPIWGLKYTVMLLQLQFYLAMTQAAAAMVAVIVLIKAL